MVPTVFGNRLIRKIYGPNTYRVGNGEFQIMKGFVIYTGYIKCGGCAAAVIINAVVISRGFYEASYVTDTGYKDIENFSEEISSTVPNIKAQKNKQRI
jgi:hypothetical protein